MTKQQIFWIAVCLLAISFIAISFTKQSEPIIEKYEIVEKDLFEEAVQVIIDHEGWHTEKHFPYIGYGHKVVKGEKLDHTISEQEAVELVRKDLRQKCAVFREFGKDSLLLGVLAYNIGEYKLIKPDGTPKSNLVKKLKAGDRDIYDEYVSFRKAWGRVIPSIERRRITEYNTLFDKVYVTRRELN